MGIQVIETKPARLVEILQFQELSYRKDLKDMVPILRKIKDLSKYQFSDDEVQSWNHFDALMCLYSAKRHEMGQSEVIGNERDGWINV